MLLITDPAKKSETLEVHATIVYILCVYVYVRRRASSENFIYIYAKGINYSVLLITEDCLCLQEPQSIN